MNIHTDQRSASSSDFKTGQRTTGTSSSPAGSEGHADLDALRADFNTLKDTVANFVSKTSDDALQTAKQTTSDVATQIGNTASQIGDTASGIANAASEQVKTFASELERMGRNNPLGAIAGAVLVGVVIGLIGRGRS